MKKVFTAVIALAVILVIRMILSFTLSEQVAEVFCRVSLSSFSLYYILQIDKLAKTAKSAN